MMKKAERVRRALAHKKGIGVPFSIDFTGEALDAYGERLLALYAPERVMGDFKNGRLNLGEAVSLAIGNHLHYVSPPWWNWHGLPAYFAGEDTPEHLPDTAGNGSYEAFFEKLGFLRRNYDAYMLVTIWGSHFEKAYFSRGIENFLADLAASPEWSGQLLDMIIRKNLVMLENILSAKEFDGVLLGSDWGTQNDLIMSPQCWRAMIKNGEKQEYDLIHRYGKDVFIHSCGKIDRILGDLVEMGIEALHPVQPECMDLRRIKETYGAELTFYGGISTQKTLPYGTVTEVIRECEEIIRLMSEGGGYIAAPSQSIQVDVPYENVIALIDTVRAHSAE